MTAEPVLERVRGHWRFEDIRSFSDTLGALGVWVGPRTGPDKRNHAEKELFCLRRFLVAMKMLRALDFPLDVTHVPDGDGPDFRIRNGGDGVFGLEVTEAGSQEHQARLTALEKTHELYQHDIWVGDSVEGIRKALDDKTEKFDAAKYDVFGPCDLLVFDNTFSAEDFDEGELLRGLRTAEFQTGGFRRVHVASANRVLIDVAGNSPFEANIENTYEMDFANWAHDQIKRLRELNPQGIDVDNLIEELGGLVRADKRSYRSHLTVLLQHLLKWAYQPSGRSRSWGNSINAARESLEDLQDDNPSFRNPEFAGAELEKAYSRAVRNAAQETGLAQSRFPENCPFEESEIFDPEFFPEAIE